MKSQNNNKLNQFPVAINKKRVKEVIMSEWERAATLPN